MYEHISLQVWSVTHGRDGLQAAGEILQVIGVVRDDPQNVVDELLGVGDLPCRAQRFEGVVDGGAVRQVAAVRLPDERPLRVATVEVVFLLGGQDRDVAAAPEPVIEVLVAGAAWSARTVVEACRAARPWICSDTDSRAARASPRFAGCPAPAVLVAPVQRHLLAVLLGEERRDGHHGLVCVGRPGGSGLATTPTTSARWPRTPSSVSLGD
ncbi:hypothetical protein [Streptomyces rochei]|uniref:hypothetical protein n=1 Tax=Streptomyces rochei TaxID=1928 RepID=UPI00363C009A